MIFCRNAPKFLQKGKKTWQKMTCLLSWSSKTLRHSTHKFYRILSLFAGGIYVVKCAVVCVKCDRIILLQCLQGFFSSNSCHQISSNSEHNVYVEIVISRVNCFLYNQQSSFQCKVKVVSVDRWPTFVFDTDAVVYPVVFVFRFPPRMLIMFHTWNWKVHIIMVWKSLIFLSY